MCLDIECTIRVDVVWLREARGVSGTIKDLRCWCSTRVWRDVEVLRKHGQPIIIIVRRGEDQKTLIDVMERVFSAWR